MAKVKVKILKDPSESKVFTEPLIYICPKCQADLAIDDEHFDHDVYKYPIYHTLSAVSGEITKERYTCEHCGCQIEASKMRLRLGKIKILIGAFVIPVLLIILAIIFSQFAEFGIDPGTGKATAENWAGFASVCCGIFGFIWCVITGVLCALDC